MTIAAGTYLGRYEIRSKLGEGGMGEVYLAQDTQLGRTVALKILPADVATDKDRLRRFIQEARAAATLSHPNIAHIYEVGEFEGTNFIAMERVEGESLDKKMGGRRTLDVVELVEIAMQVADALDEAHTKGITHRDIKPANIMLTLRGQVKVLDFGLAKVVAQRDESIDSELATQVKTHPGMVMGTVGYMSPEQALGKRVDHRTDIWSLGVVLYEMATGKLPFVGETPNETIDRILHAQPKALARFNPDVPVELERIIKKTLRRDREERYQTAKDLYVDLKSLKRELESSERVEYSDQAGRNVAVAAMSSGSQIASVAAQKRSTQAEAAQATHPASSAEYLAGSIKRHKRAALLIMLLLSLLLAGGGYAIYRLVGQKKTALSFQSAKFTRLTSTGKASDAAISPDGKWLVHVVNDGGQQSLWLKQVAITTSNTQIIPPAEVAYTGLAFSPDGNYVYYTINEGGDPKGALYQVPVLGGATRKLLTGINSAVTFSPDGKRLAFVRSGEEDRSLIIANADGTGERVLATRRGGEYFMSTGSHGGPAWSPDGKSITCPAGNLAENAMTVLNVSVDGGEVKTFTAQSWFRVSQVAWLSDGSAILVSAQDQTYLPYQIWQVSYPAGEAQRLTNDLNGYRGISLTADANALVTVQSEQVSNLWVTPANDSAQATQITSGRSLVRGLSWTPDGKIVYESNASGDNDLFLIDSRGDNPKQLTAHARHNGYSSVTPDGRYIVFLSDRAGQPHIFRMEMDGGNQQQLTKGWDVDPSCSPDGRWIAYASSSGTLALWKVAIDGGQPVQLTDKWARYPAISPDGKQIACGYRDEPDTPPKLAIIPSDGGQPTKIITLPQGGGFFSGLRWTPDGRAVVYVDTRGGVSNLWAQPVDGSPPKQLTDFKTDRIFSFDFARDGKQLVLARGTTTDDVVLISDFK